MQLLSQVIRNQKNKIMTIKELKQKLEEFPDETEVFIDTNDYNYSELNAVFHFNYCAVLSADNPEAINEND